ncbi:MAG: hypothetical protein Q8Q23_05745 [bacterium]|nr:hypothetical protein [bacterium]
MNSQVIFTIDTKLKEKAMKKAQRAGLPFASILKFATKAFVDGKIDVDLVGIETLNSATRTELQSALKDIKKNKNISKGFNNAGDAAQYLSS